MVGKIPVFVFVTIVWCVLFDLPARYGILAVIIVGCIGAVI